jgi:hypothetical protein
MKDNSFFSKNKRSTNEYYEGELFSLHDIQNLSKKIKKRKALVFSIFLILSACFIGLYANKGISYKKTATIQYKNLETDQAFSVLELLSMSDNSTVKGLQDPKQELATNAVKNLSSMDFFNYLYQEIVLDKKISKTLENVGLEIDPTNTEQSIKNLSDFFSSTTYIQASEAGGLLNKNKPSGFFTMTFQGTDEETLEEWSNFQQKVIVSYLRKIDIKNNREARDLINSQILKTKSKIQELTDKQEEIIAESPKWTRDTFNSLATELERAKATLSGNKAAKIKMSKIFDDMLEKVRAINDGKISDLSSEDLSIDLERNLALLKSLVRRNVKGDDPSGRESEFEETDYQTAESSKNELDSSFADSYYIAQAEVFSENRVNSFEKIFKKINEEFNKKLIADNQILNLNKEIEPLQKLLASLNNSKLKLEIADFKSLNRFDLFESFMEIRLALPLSTLIISSSILSFLLSCIIALAIDYRKSSTSAIKILERNKQPLIGTLCSLNPQNVHSILQNSIQEKNLIKVISNIKEVLSAAQNKILLLTGISNTQESCTSVYHLAKSSALMNNKTLIIETNPDQNLRDIPDLSSVKNLVVARCSIRELDPLILEKSKKEYDLIFIHSKPCQQSSEAASLSLLAAASLICTDSRSLTDDDADLIQKESKLLNSEYTFVLLNNFDDNETVETSSINNSNQNGEEEIRKAS